MVLTDLVAFRSRCRGPVVRRGLAPVGCLLAGLTVLLACSNVQAGARRFAFNYEVTTQAKGALELENSVTWKTQKPSDSSFDRFEFRHELEYGVTDRWQMALYVSDWQYEDGKSVDNNGTRWRDVAVETIYNLTNPTSDPIGLALYGEVKYGDELFTLESKLLVQKNIDRFALIYNATLEAEWEGDEHDEKNGVFEQSAGVSYQVFPSLFIGGELEHEVEFAHWRETGEHVVRIGPNASLRGKSWWVTVAPLVQVTDVADEPNFETRLIFSIEF